MGPIIGEVLEEPEEESEQNPKNKGPSNKEGEHPSKNEQHANTSREVKRVPYVPQIPQGRLTFHLATDRQDHPCVRV